MENEKNELLKLTGEEKFNYESWREKIDRFNIERNNLVNIITLTRSKQNVFKTLKNMFNMDLNRYIGKKDESKKLAEDKNFEDDYTVSLLKKASGKLEEIVNNLLKFLDNTKEKVGDIRTAKYIEGEINLIIDKVKKLSTMIGKRKQPRDAKSLEEESGDKKNISDIEGKMDKIKNLEKICIINLERAKKICSMLEKYLSVSENIKRKLYREFEKKNSLVLENQKKIENLENEIGKLNQYKMKLESDLYKGDIKKEQIKEKVEVITENIVDNYNESIEYVLKSYEPSSNIRQSELKVKRLKNEIKNYGNVNPNAAIEYQKIKKRFDFLADQKSDLIGSKKSLEELIKDINNRIADYFYNKFDEIKKCFRSYFKILFPLGEGEMQLEKSNGGGYDEIGVDLNADIGNNKFVSLSLLSGGEKSLASMAFLFSIYSINSSPFYVFDEVDAALDDVNIDRFLTLIKKFSEKQQIILITHQKRTMEIADTIYGVTMQPEGVSKIISEKIGKMNAEVN